MKWKIESSLRIERRAETAEYWDQIDEIPCVRIGTMYRTNLMIRRIHQRNTRTTLTAKLLVSWVSMPLVSLRTRSEHLKPLTYNPKAL